MAQYDGHEVEIVEQYGQCARIVGAEGVTVNQPGEEEGGWVFKHHLEGL